MEQNKNMSRKGLLVELGKNKEFRSQMKKVMKRTIPVLVITTLLGLYGIYQGNNERRLLNSVYNLANTNQNRILEGSELENLALKLGVELSDEPLTPYEIKQKIKSGATEEELRNYTGQN